MIHPFPSRFLPAILLSASMAMAAGLDRARIHADYEAGDFDKVIRALESFRESGRTSSKVDSLFLEKHLAVVYAADPATRERGRYHMMRMLTLDPGAELLDMFVGEEVDGIFEKVRKESRVQRDVAPSHSARPASWSSASGPGRPASASSLSPAPAPHRVPAASRASRHFAPAAPPTAAPAPAPREPAPRLKAWNLDPVAGPASRAVERTASLRHTSAAIGLSTVPRLQATAVRLQPAAYSSAPAPAAESGAGNPSPETASRPAVELRWREPGLWVGGAAAAAVVGLTLYFSGSQPETKTRSRTFAVPAKASE